ncbi:MAG TPA: hypothetical protein VF017_14265 [Thermoanaerobaculia bacterium]|nr:hypothetical protein [Thermoanaerobaculia bacterium]
MSGAEETLGPTEVVTELRAEAPEEAVAIRPLEGVAELEAAERLQWAVWGEGAFVVVPTVMLVIGGKAGGATLGAFTANGRMVGVVSWIPGWSASGRRSQYSVMLAVDPGYRGGGLGYRLKVAQREHVLAGGVTLINWTFDPLLSLNAHLNIRKLGCVCNRYLVNYYGEDPASTARQLPTDRLFVDWRLDDQRVMRRLRGEGAGAAGAAPHVNTVAIAGRFGFEHNERIELGLDAPKVLVTIPSSYQAMRRRDLALALRWRMEIREVFLSYFGRGYEIEGMTVDGPGGGSYVLSRRVGNGNGRLGEKRI